MQFENSARISFKFIVKLYKVSAGQHANEHIHFMSQMSSMAETDFVLCTQKTIFKDHAKTSEKKLSREKSRFSFILRGIPVNTTDYVRQSDCQC